MGPSLNLIRAIKRTVPRVQSSFKSACATRPTRISLRRAYSATPESYIKYQHIEDVESLSNYCKGGYHPVGINDCLRGRYHLVHKLGHGTFSTVWLAHDANTSQYVGLKVGTADAEKTEVDTLLNIQSGVSASSCEAEKASMISMPLDHFDIHGPNGTHPCLVTTPARCSLKETKEGYHSRLFQLDVGRSLAAQLTLAISLIHSQGYAHGDLHLGNLLLKLPSSLNHLSVEQLYETLGAPEPEPVTRVDGNPILPGSGVPSHAVPSLWLGTPSAEVGLAEANLLLSDFGVAFRPSDRSRFESFTPLVLRPPEAYFEPTTALSFGSDIWSLGCVIFEFLAHRSLIDGDYLAPQDDIIAQQIHLQGPPPSEWQGRYENRAAWFDEAWKPCSEDCAIFSWDRRFEESVQNARRRRDMEPVDAEEKAALLELLQWMLAWRPEERPTAEQVLETKWMKNWALPSYEKARN